MLLSLAPSSPGASACKAQPPVRVLARHISLGTNRSGFPSLCLFHSFPNKRPALRTPRFAAAPWVCIAAMGPSGVPSAYLTLFLTFSAALHGGKLASVGLHNGVQTRAFAAAALRVSWASAILGGIVNGMRCRSPVHSYTHNQINIHGFLLLQPINGFLFC